MRLNLPLAFALQFTAVLAGNGQPVSAQHVEQAAPTAVRSASVSPDSSFDKQRFEAEVVKRQQLPNWHPVHPFLYRSGAPDRVGLQEAKKLGIGTILDLRNPGEVQKKGDESLWAKELGLRYYSMPMGPKPPTKREVDKFMALAKQAQSDPKSGALLVHCAHGSDRTGCLVGIWRVTQDGWSFDKAYDEMRHYWFYPKFIGLSGAVRDYAEGRRKL